MMIETKLSKSKIVNRKSKIRVGVVGLGSFGRLHALTLTGLAEAELVALVDQREASLADLKESLPGVRGWTDLGEALREAEAEAWIIATRTESHVPLAEQILTSGAHVLIEKPLAESLAAARRLGPLAAANPNRVMLGHLLLFAAEFRQLLQEVRQRGPLIHFHLSRHRPSTTWDIYRETPFRLLMVHDLYLAFALMEGQEPARLTGRLHRREGGGFDLARAELEWANGTWGSLTASYLTPPGMGSDGFDRIEVFGQGWAARLRLNPQPLELWGERAEWPLSLNIYADPAAPAGWLAEELRHFCRVVAGQAEPPLGAWYEDGLQIQSWLERLEGEAIA
ncbi:MAG: gfo/Idh/MocA family oxidoreductase [Anaerolineae bacterium]|nr:Gfo/Idh/MocA family oxidoreductase [Anaerolineales bacterium]MCQ3979770.1 gfo/Idh/MocA family oxidoreductase [Anaerolineae bacterium]